MNGDGIANCSPAGLTIAAHGTGDDAHEAQATDEARRHWGEIVGTSPSMKQLREEIERAIEGELPVCIEGETGTGKELIARAIHFCSARRPAPFVVLDCTAVPDALIESELFGHTRGAFTDARGDKKGLFEIADGGTMFLDEVASASPLLQIKLLRVLQEGEFLPVGSVRPRRVNVHVVSAANVPLVELVRQGTLREDLFYRLYVFAIRVPPLRERRGDIPLLARHFLARRAFCLHRALDGFSEEALEVLASYAFPGNVRELKNEVERAIAMTRPAERTVDVRHLSDAIRSGQGATATAAGAPAASEAPAGSEGLREAMMLVEARLIRERLAEHGGNVSRTARSLGLSRRGLTKKIHRLGLRDDGLEAVAAG